MAMRLTRYTDYALRVLIHLAAHPKQFSSIAEISAAFGVSQNHLMKVVQGLAASGHVETLRGRNGGLRLAKAPGDIRIGAIVREFEESLDLADCGACVIAPACGLKHSQRFSPCSTAIRLQM
jgi:Rrf2 family transcriptional regulator, nitric oxide-sensitive transcriptional repressor